LVTVFYKEGQISDAKHFVYCKPKSPPPASMIFFRFQHSFADDQGSEITKACPLASENSV